MIMSPNETRFLKVSEIRTKRGMSVEEMANKADIAYNTALAYDRDSSELISKVVIKKLANALEVRVSELFVDHNGKEA